MFTSHVLCSRTMLAHRLQNSANVSTMHHWRCANGIIDSKQIEEGVDEGGPCESLPLPYYVNIPLSQTSSWALLRQQDWVRAK